MYNPETCRKRKYKKPLLKKCQSLQLPVNESMSIDELCEVYDRHFASYPMKTQYQQSNFDFIAKYILQCFHR